MNKRITEARAERIAKAHACEKCGEYSYKRVSVKPPPANADEEVAWVAEKTCGVCGTEHELGITADGRIHYVT